MPERNAAVVILVTAPDESSADNLARRLVDERLVACANILPGLRSVYRWRGTVEEASEVLLVLKARRADVGVVAERVEELHPYEVPEVIALDVTAGHAPYLDWVISETQRG